jgi:hypothetical protein
MPENRTVQSCHDRGVPSKFVSDVSVCMPEQDGNEKATTAAQAAGTPFFGVFGPYTKARDPWQTPAVRQYNHYFYRKTLEYLDSRGVRSMHAACTRIHFLTRSMLGSRLIGCMAPWPHMHRILLPWDHGQHAAASGPHACGCASQHALQRPPSTSKALHQQQTHV